MQDFLNSLARSSFGMTKQEAHEKGICISCKRPINSVDLSEVDRDEYRISGTCPQCFAEIATEEEN